MTRHERQRRRSESRPPSAESSAASRTARLRFHEAMLEQLPEAVFAKDARTGRLIYANSAAEELSGVRRDELLDKTTEEIFPSDDNDYYARTDRQAIESHAMVEMPAIEIHTPHRGRRVIRARKVPIFDEPGAPRYVVGIAEDITERAAETDEMRELTRRLERSNRDLEQFAYAASHDLQEPLRAVAGYVRLLQRRYQDRLDERANGYIEHAVEGAERMRRLIEALLTYSRVTRRGKPFRTTDFEQLLAGVLDDLAPAIDETGAQVTHDRLPTIEADGAQITQVLQNLIGNGLKYHREDVRPEVHISVEEREDHWHFAVSDNGIGIDPRHYDRIFGVFARLHTRDEYPGTGLGLALCKRIVERHGGEIWVTKNRDHGSTFHFTLSKCPEATGEQAVR